MDVPVEVLDSSGTSYDFARKEGVKKAAVLLGVPVNQIYVFGVY